MLKISFPGCCGLSPVISTQFTLEMYVAASSCEKKLTINSYFVSTMSFKVIDVVTTGKLIGSACYDKQQVCVYLLPFSC